MPRRITRSLCSGFAIVVILSASALPQSLSKHQKKAIDAAVADFMKANNIPAASVAVGIREKIVFSKGYGMADLEQNVPVTPKTRFRTGSIAKPITAVGAMQLAEKGKLDLNAPVQRYCPVFPKKEWTVTTRQLLSHRAGVRHYRNETENANAKHYASLNDSITGIFGNDPLLFEPGTKMTYSSYGYVVIGCAMEGASSSPYAKYMTENVFTPAGMSDTAVDDSAAIVFNRVRFYDRGPGTVTNAPFFDSSDRIPGGGFVSTPEDLLRFVFALQSGKLMSSKTLDEMWTSAGARDDKADYALGWNIAKVASPPRVIFHNGAQVGASARLAVDPDDHIVYAIMTDVRGLEWNKFASTMEKIVFPARATASK